MAYFSNGSEGEYYEQKYCRRCVHGSDEAVLCPVMVLHQEWNYEAIAGGEDDPKNVALNTLWPRCDDDNHNEACAMFVEVEEK